jgi:Zn-dependent protease
MAHVDLLGLLALVTVGFGWGRPVPFNPYNLRDQKWGPAIVGGAGPFANAILILICAAALRLVGALAGLPPDNALVFFLAFMVRINAALLFFNLIPIPPLDGSKFLLSALSDPKHYRLRLALETRGPVYLLLLILADTVLFNGLVFGAFFGFLIGAVTRLFGLGDIL